MLALIIFGSGLVLSEGFPDISDGKESACSAGNLGSIPELGRSPGKGIATHSSFLPGEFHGQWSLSLKELDTIEWLTLLLSDAFT